MYEVKSNRRLRAPVLSAILDIEIIVSGKPTNDHRTIRVGQNIVEKTFTIVKKKSSHPVHTHTHTNIIIHTLHRAHIVLLFLLLLLLL